MSPASGGVPLPTFLIIGAERGATRWLRSNLDRHPEVFAPPVDLAWFSDVEAMRARGGRWYQSQFDAWDGEPVLGESSGSYLMLRHQPVEVAARIHQRIPDVRLVALIRQPVDRLESAVRQQVKRGKLPADVDVYDLVHRNHPSVTELDLIGAGLYATCLYPFLRQFGDQLLVIEHSEVCDRPHAVYEQVLRHIGADPDFAPDGLDLVRFSDRTTVTMVPELSDEQRRVLYSAFRIDVEELEALLDRDLSHWDPGPPPLERAAEVEAVLRAVPPTGPEPRVADLLQAEQEADLDEEADGSDVDDRGETAVVSTDVGTGASA